MRVLAFDACLGAVSAAAGRLGADGDWTVLATERKACVAGHAEQLMPMLAGVMERAGFGFKDLDRVAVTVGPGGFTGVRVGVAAARALALATGCKLVGVTSLEALAEEARLELAADLSGRDLIVAVDARREMVFYARFGAGGTTAPEPLLLSVADAAAEAAAGAAAVIVGSAARMVAEHAHAGEALRVALADLQPDAASVARLGALRTPDEQLRPLYLRPPDAKAQTSMILPRAQT